MRTRVKICGITRIADAQSAVALGADAVGLVFAHAGPRRLDIARAGAIASTLPPFVARVGVFCDNPEAEIAALLGRISLDLLQFHGGESAAFCRQWERPWMKAVPMNGIAAPDEFMAQFPQASGFVLDAHGAGEVAGKGRSFDWSRIPPERGKPLVLAGGLQPDNVFDAIMQSRPYAVDVSTGVESAPGEKDAGLMAAFISEVHRAGREAA